MLYTMAGGLGYADHCIGLLDTASFLLPELIIDRAIDLVWKALVDHVYHCDNL